MLCALVKFEPLDQVPPKFLSFKTALLLALMSAKSMCDLSAMSMAPSGLRIQGDGSSAVLCPNPAFTPKNITSSYWSRVITLEVFSLPDITLRKRPLCILFAPCTLSCYIARTATLRKSEAMFVHFREHSQGLPCLHSACLTECARQCHWLIRLLDPSCQTGSGLIPPGGFQLHSPARWSVSAGHLHCGILVIAGFIHPVLFA